MQQPSTITEFPIKLSDKKYAGSCDGCQQKKKKGIKINPMVFKMNVDGSVKPYKPLVMCEPSAQASEEPKTDDSDLPKLVKASKLGQDKSGSQISDHSLGSKSETIKSLLKATGPFKSTKSVRKLIHKGQEEDQTRLMAMTVLERIRIFVEKKNLGTMKEPKGICQAEREREPFCRLVLKICDRVEKIFEAEERILAVKSPALVMGDIHGNITDLLSHEKILWKSAPYVCPASVVFCGDYVDRGKWGVECVLYMFSMKLLLPEKFFFLRGNHEIQSVQEKFSFVQECHSKYGDEIGKKILDRINTVFDKLPIAAVIDNRVFCAHGGIPKLVYTLEELKKMPKDLLLDEDQSEELDQLRRAAWDIMWSDPADEADSLYDAERGVIHWSLTNFNQMYLNNDARGTSYYYTDAAVDRFLEVNRLSHIIRAHQMKDVGYQIHFDGKVITVFSCSHYGQLNEAACVLVDDEKLRILKLNTAENAPAVDGNHYRN